ncbi:multicopper oxidase CueO [Rosenbergiella australiborealis]|uniref:multicopper oxidase CueO n=1 Tax=Rosenbergiella australiborealis TaxID=1544696 RepID=UPI001F4D74C5|nr:multicopper oxidase CueO [Rosenbergiella australiborealis]
MQRRDFLKLSSLLIGAGALPAWSREAMASQRPLLTTPILLEPDLHQRIDITAMAGKSLWNNKTVSTWGYNGAYLGPTIKLRRHQPVSLRVYNQLPVETTVHWHGLVVGGEVDGGPQEVIKPGTYREVAFTPDQPAATCWYHPHPHMTSGLQVAKGLAGLLVIEDEPIKTLRIPSQWGVDDIPLVFQDKKLTAEGTDIDYQLDIMHASVGWFGDMMLTNGSQYPQIGLPSGWVRLRLLNGCNARSMNLALSHGKPMYVIASDGGLLAEPVKVEQLPILPGERFEVMIELTDTTPFDLVTLPVTQIGMTLPPFDQPLPVLKILPLRIEGSAELPDKLVTLPSVPSTDGLIRRRVRLSMDAQLDAMGMQQLMQRYGQKAMAGMPMHSMSSMPDKMSDSMQNSHASMPGMASGQMADHNYDFHQGNKINGKAYQINDISWQSSQGQHEIWEISGEGDMMLHPFHIHGTQYRILSENDQPVPAHRQGWKDTVRVEGGVSQVMVLFPHTADRQSPYMAHCHLLEHEDTGMMMSFTVGKNV